MKRSNYIIYLKLITFLFIINSTSCDDMNSIHEDYLQGEQVYAGKLDTLEVRPAGNSVRTQKEHTRRATQTREKAQQDEKK